MNSKPVTVDCLDLLPGRSFRVKLDAARDQGMAGRVLSGVLELLDRGEIIYAQGFMVDADKAAAVAQGLERLAAALRAAAGPCERIQSDGKPCGLYGPCPDCGSSLIDYPEGP